MPERGWEPDLQRDGDGSVTRLRGCSPSFRGFTSAIAGTTTSRSGPNKFTLDGRWLHAFNGPGAGRRHRTTTGLPASYYGNYRFTGR